MPRRRSILDGMSLQTLQTQLAAMQQAWIDLSSGTQGESFSYTQGEGSKAVTYTRANAAQLVYAIKAVQAQIDRVTLQCSSNGPMTPYFG